MDHCGVGDRDVGRASVVMGEVLGPLVERDWSVRAGTLDWSCRETLVHIGHDLLGYAAQLAGRAQDAYLPLDLVVHDDVTPAQALAVAVACGGLLVAALRDAGPEIRAWHFGPCDASGFAALGVAEILLHTYDITQGLGVGWRPPVDLSAAVLARLLPDTSTSHPTEHRDATETLLRHTGRLGDVGEWRWQITP